MLWCRGGKQKINSYRKIVFQTSKCLVYTFHKLGEVSSVISLTVFYVSWFWLGYS